MTLLDLLDFDDTSASTIFIVFILLPVITLIINYFFLRYTFEVKKQLKLQRLQLDVLIKVAKKLGVDESEFKAKEEDIEEEKNDFWKMD